MTVSVLVCLFVCSNVYSFEKEEVDLMAFLNVSFLEQLVDNKI